MTEVKVILQPWSKVTQISLLSTFFQTSSHQKSLGQSVKVHVDPPWDQETKVCSNDPGHMTKVAAMLIYVTFSKLLRLGDLKFEI